MEKINFFYFFLGWLSCYINEFLCSIIEYFIEKARIKRLERKSIK